jgi:hypothetical protein
VTTAVHAASATRHQRIARTHEQTAAPARSLQATIERLGRKCAELTDQRDALASRREQLHDVG